MNAFYNLVVVLVVVAIFLICRELICWYWKLNKLVRLLESIDARLERLESKATPPPSSAPSAPKPGKSRMLPTQKPS